MRSNSRKKVHLLEGTGHRKGLGKVNPVILQSYTFMIRLLESLLSNNYTLLRGLWPIKEVNKCRKSRLFVPEWLIERVSIPHIMLNLVLRRDII